MGKINTAVYLYDHLMISAIVLIATVFILFNHAKNKKIMLKFFRRKGGNVWVLEGETMKKKERIVLFIDSRRRLFSN